MPPKPSTPSLPPNKNGSFTSFLISFNNQIKINGPRAAVKLAHLNYELSQLYILLLKEGLETLKEPQCIFVPLKACS